VNRSKVTQQSGIGIGTRQKNARSKQIPLLKASLLLRPNNRQNEKDEFRSLVQLFEGLVVLTVRLKLRPPDSSSNKTTMQY